MDGTKIGPSAEYDNQVANFLVKFCAEEDDLSSSAPQLYSAYLKNFGEIISARASQNRCMTMASFVDRLEKAGFRKVDAIVEYPDGGGKSWTRSKIEGVALIDPADAERPRKLGSGAASSTHVRVNGVLYDRKLISTVRPIRGFEKHGTRETMKAIVTFSNPEMRHQFVSETEAMRIEEELNDRSDKA